MKHDHKQWQRCTEECEGAVVPPRNNPGWTPERMRAALDGLAQARLKDPEPNAER